MSSSEIRERKATFRRFVELGGVDEATHGFRHSSSYIQSVLEDMVETSDLSEAIRLLRVEHELTSTPLGAAAVTISETILEDVNISRQFIDAEVLDERIIFHFDRGAQGFEKVVEQVLTDFGSLKLLAVPGDEMFEGLFSENFIFSLVPDAEVIESVEMDYDDADLSYVEEEEDEDDDEDDDDTDDDEGVDEEVFAVYPFDLDESVIDEALEEAELTGTDIDGLFELCYFGESENAVEEAKKKPPKMKIVKRAKAAGGKNWKGVRTRMLRALAQKGFLVHGTYKKKGNRSLIAKWKKFKKKGASAGLRALKKGGAGADVIKAARLAARKAGKNERTLIDALPYLNEAALNLYCEHILEDLGLLNETDAYLVTPFEFDASHDKWAGKEFTDEEVEALFTIAFAEDFGDDDEDMDEAKKMKIKKRAAIAAKNLPGVNKATMRTRMLRAIAAKGFLNQGKYKKGGVPSMIAKWRKFKKKGSSAALRGLKKQGMGGALLKAAKAAAKAKKPFIVS